LHGEAKNQKSARPISDRRAGFLRHRRAEAVGHCRELGGDDLLAVEDAMFRRGWGRQIQSR
jgi:hypothetical protein